MGQAGAEGALLPLLAEARAAAGQGPKEPSPTATRATANPLRGQSCRHSIQ